MKNKIYFMSFMFLFLTFFNCSKENISEESEILQLDNQFNNINSDSTSKYVCNGGFGIFSNVDYDCGYKSGIERYIEDYNKIIEDFGYPECETLSFAFVHETHPSDEDMDDPEFTIIEHLRMESQTYNNSGLILQTMASVYNEFRQWCNPNPNDNDNTKGFKAGYLAFWGQQPLSADPSSDCN